MHRMLRVILVALFGAILFVPAASTSAQSSDIITFHFSYRGQCVTQSGTFDELLGGALSLDSTPENLIFLDGFFYGPCPAPATLEPTVDPWTPEPTVDPWTPEPTEVPVTPDPTDPPTVDPWTPEPTDVPVTPDPTNPPTELPTEVTQEPTAVPTTNVTISTYLHHGGECWTRTQPFDIWFAAGVILGGTPEDPILADGYFLGSSCPSTATVVPSETVTSTVTVTATETSTATVSPTETATVTATVTETATSTTTVPTTTATATETVTTTPVVTATSTAEPTVTETPIVQPTVVPTDDPGNSGSIPPAPEGHKWCRIVVPEETQGTGDTTVSIDQSSGSTQSTTSAPVTGLPVTGVGSPKDSKTYLPVFLALFSAGLVISYVTARRNGA